MNTEEMRELTPTGSSRRSSTAHVAWWGCYFVSSRKVTSLSATFIPDPLCRQ